MQQVTIMVLWSVIIVLTACNQNTPQGSEEEGENKGMTEVTKENFTIAETDKYFAEHAKEHPVNTIHHSRKMSSVDNQFVIRENQDVMYSNALVDISEGATVINPPWDVYSSIQVIDEHHYTVDVLYPGDTLKITKDMVELGDHVYLNIRTGVPSLDSAGFAEAHRHQDSYVVKANSSEPYEPKGFDPASLDSVRNLLLPEATTVKAWRAFGAKEEVDSLDFLLASAAGWAGLPVKHATYITNIQPSGKALEGQCARITLPAPPLKFDEGGFFSVTTYGPDGYIATDNFALNNRQAEANPDGTYTFHFSCEGAKNNIDVLENWNMTIRLYMPESLDAILEYIEKVNQEVEVKVVQGNLN